jgi:hypothetical protein
MSFRLHEENVFFQPISYVENRFPPQYNGNKVNRDVHTENNLLHINSENSQWKERPGLVEEALPYKTFPKLYSTPSKFDRLLPNITNSRGKSCFSDTLSQRGPFYDTYFQIFDYAPIKPQIDNTMNDPRYNSVHDKIGTSSNHINGF